MPLGARIDKQSKSSNSPSGETKVISNKKEPSIFRLEKPKYSFSEIILNNDTYDSIQDMLCLYQKRDLIFNKWGLSGAYKQKNRVGINLYGVPGTGKTMAAHAIANQIGKPILIVDYSQIESKYVGETSKNLNAMFDYAKETESILFFDEADALLSKRVTDMSSSTDVSVNQTRSVLLTLINDFDGLILFATNFLSNYDPAFMRRISMHIRFDLPDEQNRIKLWKLYIPDKMPIGMDVDNTVKILARKYASISGSDIANAVLAAALKAARNNDSYVKLEYFENAIERIIESKSENTGETFSKRTVSENYVKSQFGGELPK